jgi:hypothetical protein
MLSSGALEREYSRPRALGAERNGRGQPLRPDCRGNSPGRRPIGAGTLAPRRGRGPEHAEKVIGLEESGRALVRVPRAASRSSRRRHQGGRPQRVGLESAEDAEGLAACACGLLRGPFEEPEPWVEPARPTPAGADLVAEPRRIPKLQMTLSWPPRSRRAKERGPQVGKGLGLMPVPSRRRRRSTRSLFQRFLFRSSSRGPNQVRVESCGDRPKPPRSVRVTDVRKALCWSWSRVRRREDPCERRAAGRPGSTRHRLPSRGRAARGQSSVPAGLRPSVSSRAEQVEVLIQAEHLEGPRGNAPKVTATRLAALEAAQGSFGDIPARSATCLGRKAPGEPGIPQPFAEAPQSPGSPKEGEGCRLP